MDILQMSLSASVLIVAVVIIRALALHKLPKKTFLVLWGVAVCRLLVPFSISSRFSFYTGIDRIKRMFAENAITPPSPAAITSGANTANIAAAGETIGTGASTATAAISVSPIEIAWFAGICICAVLFIVAYIKCRREFKTSLPFDNDFVACWLREHSLRRPLQIRQSDRIKAPLTYGVFRPVILLPKTIDCSDEVGLTVILAHEFTHIRRFDALIKLVLAAAVCVHWFNPFVWVMYVLANRDIELACDEAVVWTFGETMKSAYAMTLIGWEERKSSLAPLISGFSKNAIEERITAIMKIKKTSLVGLFLALALVIGTVTVFATNAAKAADASSGDTNYSDPSNSITTAAGTIVPSSVDFGTHMEIELIKGSTLTIGRETWEKGDEIVFRISADEDMELYVGILPAESMDGGFGYNDYGQFIQKKLDVSSEVQEVSFIVPETGEYGIGVQHIKDEVKATVGLAPEVAATDISDEDDNAALLLRLMDNEEKVNSLSKTEAYDTVTFNLEINKVFENPLINSQAESSTTIGGGKTAEPLSNSDWVWPVEGCDTVTSAFGTRYHPITDTTEESDHICISGDNADGAKVYAALAGTVLETGYDTEQGNYIVIAHDNGIETSYQHLKEILVSDGDSVAAGGTIGTVGSTGTAIGPCLGFCVYVNGEAVNPLDYFILTPAAESAGISATDEEAIPTAEPVSSSTSVKDVPAEPISEEALPAYWEMGALNVDGVPYLPLVDTAEYLGYSVSVSSFKIADVSPEWWEDNYPDAIEYNYELTKDGKTVGIASLDIAEGSVVQSMVDQIFCDTQIRLSFVIQDDTVYMPAQFFKEALDTENILP